MCIRDSGLHFEADPLKARQPDGGTSDRDDVDSRILYWTDWGVMMSAEYVCREARTAPECVR